MTTYNTVRFSDLIATTKPKALPRHVWLVFDALGGADVWFTSREGAIAHHREHWRGGVWSDGDEVSRIARFELVPASEFSVGMPKAAKPRATPNPRKAARRG